MKIGILTFWWAQDNYGQVLQAYALQKYLNDKGHEVFFIQYKFITDLKHSSLLYKLLKLCNPVCVWKYFSDKITKKKILAEQKVYDRNFDDFRKKYFVMTDKDYIHYTDIVQNPPKCDAYIVGSDQVWNYWNKKLNRFKNPLHAYFLDFGDEKTKRISYAASWGRIDIPSEYKKEIIPLLAKFDYISVRESNGVDLCSQCGRDDAEWVCDPTLLLSAADYRNLYKGSNKRLTTKKYLLLYMLQSEINFDIERVYQFANDKNIDVVYVTGNGVLDNRKKYFATIPEWLYLIDNAEYVITNSFHCSVFSTIFHKQFGVVALTGGSLGMNARFDSLFELCGTDNRYLTNDDFSVLDEPYQVKEVQHSKKFIDMLK